MERSERDKFERKIVINHSQKAHEDFASTSQGSASILSFTQKEYIVRNYDQNVNPDVFVTKMISNKMSPSIPEQKTTRNASRRRSGIS